MIEASLASAPGNRRHTAISTIDYMAKRSVHVCCRGGTAIHLFQGERCRASSALRYSLRVRFCARTIPLGIHIETGSAITDYSAASFRFASYLVWSTSSEEGLASTISHDLLVNSSPGVSPVSIATMVTDAGLLVALLIFGYLAIRVRNPDVPRWRTFTFGLSLVSIIWLIPEAAANIPPEYLASLGYSRGTGTYIHLLSMAIFAVYVFLKARVLLRAA